MSSQRTFRASCTVIFSSSRDLSNRRYSMIIGRFDISSGMLFVASASALRGGSCASDTDDDDRPSLRLRNDLCVSVDRFSGDATGSSGEGWGSGVHPCLKSKTWVFCKQHMPPLAFILFCMLRSEFLSASKSYKLSKSSWTLFHNFLSYGSPLPGGK